MPSVPLSFGVRHDFRQPLPRPQPYARYYEECIQAVRHAEALGFDVVWVTEHHFWNDGYLPSALAMLVALARETRRMTLGTSVVLLPLYHPLRVAEDATLVDLVSDGRLILGLGLGYVLHEFHAFEAERSRRGQLLDEGLTVIKQAWEQGRVDFQGRRWQFHDVVCEPRPVQLPRPPIYLGGSSSRAYERLAREADGYLDPGGMTSREAIAGRYAGVKAALERHGRSIAQFPFVLGPSCHLDEDPEKAWLEAAPAIAYQENQYLQYGTDPDKPRPPAITSVSLSRPNYLVGSPAEVLERLCRLHDDVPYTQVCVWGRLPGLTHEQASHSLELFARDIMPGLRSFVAAKEQNDRTI